MSASDPIEVDVAIAGGGLVGASLALALADTPLRVLVVEAVAPDDAAQPSFDERTTALGNGSRRIFETLGAWTAMAAAAAPIREIQVSEEGRFGQVRLSAAELGLDAFGCVLPNRVLGQALWARLRAGAQRGGRRAALEICVPARLESLQLQSAAAEFAVLDRAGERRRYRARLMVAADGAHSLVRAAAGIGAVVADYRQVAITTQFQAERAPAGVAYERFSAQGPLAVLPLNADRHGLVWTRDCSDAAQALAWSDAQFISALQARLGWRLGAVLGVGARASYPLALSRATRLTAGRVVLIGNAAQALHPVAGQGFNLGLRDAADLAERLAGAADAGDPVLLERFERERAGDRRAMVAFTDALVRGFAGQRAPLPVLRSLGLLAFDLSPPAKRALSRLSWGFGGRAPRLMRGLRLSPPGMP